MNKGYELHHKWIAPSKKADCDFKM